MSSIKFVQWLSSFLIAFVVISGFVSLFTRLASIDEWIKFAGIAAMFIAPEKVVAFFGPVLKRKQQNGHQERMNGGK
jgi:hypothetical protein